MANNESSIRISGDLRKKLMKMKLDLDLKSIDEVINRLIKLVRKLERQKK